MGQAGQLTDRDEEVEQLAGFGGAWLRTELLDSLGQAVIATDLAGKVIYWNRAAEQTYGWAPQEALGRQISDLTVAEMSADQAAEIMAALTSGQEWSGEFLVRHRDGRVFPALVTDTPVISSCGDLVGIVGITTDLTERKAAEAATSKLAALVAASDDAIVGTDPRGSIVSWNPAAERLFGYSEPEILGRPISDLALPEGREALAAKVTKPLASGQAVRVSRTRAVRRDGSAVHISLSAAPVRAADGTVTGLAWMLRDVTADVAAEAALASSEYRFRRMFEQNPSGIALVDRDGIILEANSAFVEMLGYSVGEVKGRHARQLTHPDDLDKVFDAALYGSAQESCLVEKRYLRADGRAIPARVTGVALRDAEGRVEAGLGIVEDLTSAVQSEQEREQLLSRLNRQAVTDPLTRLPNRALVKTKLSRALQRMRSSGGSVGVMFLDLDRFKVVNDSLGHAVGDQLLRAVGRRLQAATRAGDLVGRFGGDEFVVVVGNAGCPDDLARMAERMLESLRKPFSVAGLTLSVDGSIGIACTSDPACSPQSLIDDADLAMYRSKAKGGRAVELFHPVMREKAVSRFSFETELRTALAEQQLGVHYQPYVTPDGVIKGVEALVRWEHPVRGLLMPGQFIPLAEETGLIVPIGQSVLSQACRQAAAWRAELCPDLELSVNLSVCQLLMPDTAEMVERALSDTGIPPSALCLEITETALLQDPQAASATLHSLSDLGVSLAVDDFGTGYSSLLYLRHFPAQVLKLDRFFVSGLGTNPKDAAIVHSVIDLARTLRLRTIAEGVESSRQVELLRDFGCDLLQGYYWSRPLDSAAPSGRLAERRLLP